MNRILFNGSAYKQKEFPNCEFMVLMLGSVNKELQFCRVAGYPDMPLVITDACGKFMYTEEEMFRLIDILDFSKIGLPD